MAWISIVNLILGIGGLYLLKIFLQDRNRTSMRAPLPPGPKPQFLVGNLKDLPKPGQREWEHWLKHKDLYSMYTTGLALRVMDVGGIIMPRLCCRQVESAR
jgi:hypothetical protein